MPDSRRHRGAHPEDARLFAPDQWPALQRAGTELAWLLDRGYAMRSSLALVGDRHALTERQRLALARCTCDETRRARRREHERPREAVAGAELWLDGYNLLICVESALGGGVILSGRDGCYRDLASLHGTYREVSETIPALTLIGRTLAHWGAGRCHWLLDRPVSNSGRLRGVMLALATESGWDWEVELDMNPDVVLARLPGLVVSSDSMILDRCQSWVNAARDLIASEVPDAWVVEIARGE